jgi:D-glycero-alpha-D-manno-heptose-7-phosphate kinase
MTVALRGGLLSAPVPIRQIAGPRRRDPVPKVVCARAPLRISFAGGGTDLPQYYEAHGGAVVSGTIACFAYATVAARPDREVRIRSHHTSQMAVYNLDTGPLYDGTLDLVKAAIQRTDVDSGVDVGVHVDVSAGSGLGGSSALTAAVLRALDILTGQVRSRYELAELNYLVERHDLGIPGGKQDQYATTFGGFNFFDFQHDGVRVDRLSVGPVLVSELAERLLLCFTGGVRADTTVIGRQVALYRAGRKETVAGLHEMHALAYQTRAALVAGRLDEVGGLLHAGYLHKKRTNPYLTEGTAADRLYDTALRNGATGGKLCGAGGGGYLLFYCRPDQRQDVRISLEHAGGRCVDVAFEQQGVRPWPLRPSPAVGL